MYLKHYGVEGQKWGVQNGPPYPISDATRKRMIMAQRRQDYNNRILMSDEDLQNHIKRLEMEKKYRELNNEMVQSGKSFASKVLKDAWQKTLTNIATGLMVLAVGRGVTAITGSKDFGSTIAKGSYSDSEVKSILDKEKEKEKEKGKK